MKSLSGALKPIIEMVNVKVSLPGLKHFLDNVMIQAPMNVKKAVARTLNETMIKSQGIMARQASSVYDVTQAEIRKSFSTWTANYKDMRAGVRSADNKFNLVNFGVKATKRENRKSAGKVMISELRGRRTPVSHGFMAIVGSGHLGIFRRKGKGRYPIIEMVAGSAPQMIHAKRNWPIIQLELQDFFWKNLKRNVNFYVNVRKS